MKSAKTGQYPEFYCGDGGVIPKCTVRWTDIVTSVPEQYIREEHINAQIPEVTFVDTQMVVNIPEFSMGHQKSNVGVPQVHSNPLTNNEQKIKDRAQALSLRAIQTRESQTNENASGIKNVYSCYRTSIAAQQSDADSKFAKSIELIDRAIQSLSAQGADPAKVTDGSNIVDLTVRRANVAAKRDDALASFNAVLVQLNADEKAAKDGLRLEDAASTR
jgi:hypothetical protein